MTRSMRCLLVLTVISSWACEKQASTIATPSEASGAAQQPAESATTEEPTAAEPTAVDPPTAESPPASDETMPEDMSGAELESDVEDEELWADLVEEGERQGSGGGGFGGRGKAVPSVRQATATVEGNLDKDIVRRIVRAHINEIRSCYNAGLSKDAALAGEVTIEFTIAADGLVNASQVAESNLADATVGECMAKAVKKWKFPKPTGGGEVRVVYPFLLEPG